MSDIDKRIVEMQFDNAQFEQGIGTSIKSLGNLQKSLVMDTASSGMNVLNGAVQTVANKFSMMSVMGVTALANITNSAINSAKRLLSSITIDPVAAGRSEYELTMNSIQVLMSGTGESLDRVKEKLGELNTYSDQTIYSFADMTNNIGKFTNAGVSLDDSVESMKGIANWAALSGASANDAARAMYNLGQALGQGSVKLIDWKSVENANMGTRKAKNELIKTAKEFGYIDADGKTTSKANKSGIEVTAENMQTTLEHAWLTSDVLLETLKRFTDRSTDLGREAYEAATEVRTLTQLLDVLVEGAQSGWSQSWQLIIGDYGEAKHLFTQLNDTFGGLIEASANARNALLTGWRKFGGRDNIFKGFENLYNIVFSVTTVVRDAFKSIFPPITARKLATMSKSFSAFTEGLLQGLFKVEGGTSRFRKIEKAFKGFFSIFKIGMDVVKSVGGPIWDFLKPILSKSLDGLLNFFANVGESITSFASTLTTNEKFVSFIKHLTDALSWLSDVVDVGWAKISDFFTTNFPVWLEIANKYLAPFTEKLKGWVEAIRTTFRTDILGDRGKDTTKSIFQILKEMFATPEGIEEFKNNTIAFIKKQWESVKKSITEIFGKDGKFEKIGTFFAPFISKLTQFGTDFKAKLRLLLDPKNLSSKKSIWEILKDTFAEPEKAKAFVNRIIESVKDAWNSLKEKIAAIFTKKDKGVDVPVKDGKPTGLFDGVFSFLEGIWTWLKDHGGTVIGGLFLAALLKLQFSALKTVNTFAKIGKTLATGWANSKAPIKKNFGSTLLKIAGAIAAVAGAIYLISTIDKDRLWPAVGIVGGIIAVLAALSKFGSSNKGQLGIPKLNTMGLNMAGMAAAVLIMVIALNSASKIMGEGKIEDWVRILPGLTLIIGLLAVMTLFTKALDDTNVKGDGWKNIIAVAAGVWILVQTLMPLKDLEWEQLGKMGAALGGIAIVVLALTHVSKLGVGSTAGKITSVIKLAIGVWLLIKALTPIADMSWEDLIKMGAALGGITAALWLLTKSMKGMNAQSVIGPILALGALAGLIYVLGNALKSIRGVSWEQIAAFTGGLSLMVISMGAGSFLSGIKKLSGLNSLLSSIGLAGIIWTLGDALSKIVSVDTNKIQTFTDGVIILTAANGVSALLSGISPWSGLNSILASGGLALVVDTLGATLVKIAGYSVDPTLIQTFTDGVSILTAANGVSALLSGISPWSGLNSILASGGLALVVDTLGATLVKIAGYSVDPALIQAFTDGVSILTVANGVSSLLGGITPWAGLNSILSSGGLAIVVDTLGGALEKIGSMGISTEKIEAFTSGVNLILDGKNQNGLVAFFSALSPITALGQMLTDFGLSGIIETLGAAIADMGNSGATPETVKTFMDALDQLHTFMTELPKKGFAKLLAEITVGTEATSFAEDMTLLSTAIQDLSTALAGIKLPVKFWFQTRVALASVRSIADFVSELNDPKSTIKVSEVNDWQAFWGVQSETDKLKKSMENLATGLEPLLTSLDKVVISEFDAKTEEVLGGVRAIATFVSDMNDPTMKVAASGWDILNPSSQLIQDMSNLGNVVGAFNTSVMAVDERKFATIINSIGGYTRALTGFLLAVDGKEGTFDGVITSIEEMASTLSTDVVDNFSEGIQNELSFVTVADAFNAILGKSQETIAESFETFILYGELIIERMSEGMGTSITSNVSTSGLNFVQGFAQGIDKYTYLATNAARTLANRTIAAFNAANRIQSPSKETQESGGYFIDGFVKGIKDKTRELLKTVKEAGKETAESFNDGIESRASKYGAVAVLASAGASDVSYTSSTNAKTKATPNRVNRVDDAGINPDITIGKKITNFLSDLGKNIGQQTGITDAVKTMAKTYVDSGYTDLYKMQGSTGWLSGLTDIIDSIADITEEVDPGKGTNTNKNKNKKPATPATPANLNYMQTIGFGRTQSSFQNDLLTSKLDNLAKAVTNMKIVMDSGTLVGQISSKMDRQLGLAATYAGRR